VNAPRTWWTIFVPIDWHVPATFCTRQPFRHSRGARNPGYPGKIWRTRHDSNVRTLPSESSALTIQICVETENCRGLRADDSNLLPAARKRHATRLRRSRWLSPCSLSTTTRRSGKAWCSRHAATGGFCERRRPYGNGRAEKSWCRRSSAVERPCASALPSQSARRRIVLADRRIRAAGSSAGRASAGSGGLRAYSFPSSSLRGS
jgi:hypothetical protein